MLNMIEETKLRVIVKKLQICFEPNEDETVITSDENLMKDFNEFENMLEERSNECDNGAKSKWIMVNIRQVQIN